MQQMTQTRGIQGAFVLKQGPSITCVCIVCLIDNGSHHHGQSSSQIIMVILILREVREHPTHAACNLISLPVLYVLMWKDFELAGLYTIPSPLYFQQPTSNKRAAFACCVCGYLQFWQLKLIE